MRRLLTSCVPLALAAALTVVMITAQGAAGARHTRNNKPELLDGFGVAVQGSPLGSLVRMNVPLNYIGGGMIEYRQLRPNDVIPRVKIVLHVPAGDKIVKSHVRLNPPNNGRSYARVKYWGRRSSSLNPKWKRAVPVWVFRSLSLKASASWSFTLRVPNGGDMCVTATATLTYKKGRHFRPIPHAPLQLGPNSYVGCQAAGSQ